MSKSIDKYQDLIDSRDVIARIEELKREREELDTDLANDDEIKAWEADCREELTALEKLAEEAIGSGDREHGETLIRDSYFNEYAQQLAEDVGAIPDDSRWPCTCIDWDQAARELLMDYHSVDFDGVDYWIRS